MESATPSNHNYIQILFDNPWKLYSNDRLSVHFKEIYCLFINGLHALAFIVVCTMCIFCVLWEASYVYYKEYLQVFETGSVQ